MIRPTASMLNRGAGTNDTDGTCRLLNSTLQISSLIELGNSGFSTTSTFLCLGSTMRCCV